MEQLGTITWQTEFVEVVSSGKPFLILCLDRTYARYLTLVQATGTAPLADADDSNLVTTLSMVEREYRGTIIQFPESGFREQLRRQLGRLLQLGLGLIEQQSRRAFLLKMSSDPSALSAQQIQWAVDLAGDDLADKTSRKSAISALAELSAATEELATDLLGSAEQGVQRLAFDRLVDLYTTRPPDPEFLRNAVEIANRSTDVGLGRRLIQSLFEMDIAQAFVALESLDLSDVGLRSRITDQLELYERQILDDGLVAEALALAERCQTESRSPRWQQRLKAFVARHTEQAEDS
ncbi:hypothetical protein GIY30_02320 [Gordonia sp. HNM0687]|uniref:Uncharacterized protein n=1 Tax=Gordonia mangrovi TaxID=2665643 RepID=A0A6L7GJY5_9ACTN|nr:hypothetical protein [Gordonia mangrovi]MXP20206.1 hypothetical protein [Gordonia mangrovi]UVF79186.1 hypothetical protein NWF22_04915 [Gordonia mangrovi]